MDTQQGLAHLNQTHTLADPPEAPDSLGTYGIDLWTSATTTLVGAGMLTTLDLIPLLELCELYDQYKTAQADYVEQGAIMVGPRGGLTINPLHKVCTDLYKIVAAGMKDFGLTPSASIRKAPPAKVAKTQAHPLKGDFV